MNFGNVVINGRTRAMGKGAGLLRPENNNINKNRPTTGFDKVTNRKERQDEDPRVPEIQMINKFYGLIPKKFLISERVRPSILLIRQKSSTVRPKTAKARPSHHGDEAKTEVTPKVKGIRKCSSVDESGGKGNSSLDTQLVTRRISFEKIPLPRIHHKSNIDEELVKESILINNNKNQRVIRIDLSQMKWEEDGEDSLLSISPKHKEKTPPTPEIKECKSEIPQNESKLQKLQNNNTKSPPQDDEETFDEKPTEILQSWTAGKTTEERRSKLQKSFSIHPSFSKYSLNSDSLDYAESETPSEIQYYPESMTRTGRRSLHVECRNEDVETMVSRRKSTRSNSKSLDNDNLLQTVFIPPSKILEKLPLQQKETNSTQKQGNNNKTIPQIHSTNQNSSNTIKEVTQQNILPKNSSHNNGYGGNGKVESAKPQPLLSLSATEKRKLFSQQRFISLPSAKELKKSESSKKNKLSAPLIRQNSSAIKSGTSGKSLSKSGTGISSFRRPKTAPITNTTSHKEPPVTKNRKQPIRARSGVVGTPNGVHSKGKEGEGEMSNTKSSVKKTTKKEGDEKKKKVEIIQETDRVSLPKPQESEVEMSPISPAPVPPQPMKMQLRRSFSLDEASLLNYSTSITDSIESIENSLQSSKRREECLKIYEKMKNGGCAVRLQTIFRGLMTPSEYRSFIAAAEKAASVEKHLSQEGTIPSDEVVTENKEGAGTDIIELIS